VIIDLLRAAKATGDYRPLMDAIPYAVWLGITSVDVDGEYLGKLTYKDELIGNPALPALHGGTLGALLESTAVFALLRARETVTVPKTITITVDYLRSAKPADTYAHATITRQGRRVVTVAVRAWQDDRERPVATANLHFLVTA
jgi:uncharacterized protein (TIGR00369 family)